MNAQILISAQNRAQITNKNTGNATKCAVNANVDVENVFTAKHFPALNDLIRKVIRGR